MQYTTARIITNARQLATGVSLYATINLVVARRAPDLFDRPHRRRLFTTDFAVRDSTACKRKIRLKVKSAMNQPEYDLKKH